jgi:hypothetical protein
MYKVSAGHWRRYIGLWSPWTNRVRAVQHIRLRVIIVFLDKAQEHLVDVAS